MSDSKKRKKLPVEKKLSKKEKKENDYANGFPENLVLYISLHGGVCVSEKCKLRKVSIPESIQHLSKLNIAPTGESSVFTFLDARHLEVFSKLSGDLNKRLKHALEESDLEVFNKIIHYYVNKYPTINTTDDPAVFNMFMQELQHELCFYYVNEFSTDPRFEKLAKSLEKGHGCKLHIFEEEPSDSSDSAASAASAASVASAASAASSVSYAASTSSTSSTSSKPQTTFLHLFPPGKKVIADKIFEGDVFEELHPIDPNARAIIVVNHKSGRNYNLLPDILKKLKRYSVSHHDSVYLSTKQILDFIADIKKDGNPVVKRVFMVDLSCQCFPDPLPYKVSDKRIGLGGGKYKSRRNKKEKSKKQTRKHI